MRHPERELKNEETIKSMLEQMPVGRIATINRSGIPVIKPVNFIYWDGKIYIHSSKKGEKIRDIRRRSPICFEVDEHIAYISTMDSACKGDYLYRSIIVKGKASLVSHKEKRREILERLMEKYQPEAGYGAIPEEVLEKTAVIEISIQEITGKEKLG